MLDDATRRAVVEELAQGLTGAHVQGVFTPTAQRVYLELRKPGATFTLLVCGEPNVARIAVVASRPPNPPRPPAWQSVLRRELVGRRLAAARVQGATITLTFEDLRYGPRSLEVELGSLPGIALVNQSGNVLALSRPPRAPLTVGKPYVPVPPPRAESSAPLKLPVVESPFPTLAALESYFRAIEDAREGVAAARPLASRKKKLLRTRSKVEAEAARGELAQKLLREGEALKGNLHLLTRGRTSVTVPVTGPNGETSTIDIALDPKRSPKEEIAWRFHHYRRYLRGVDIAKARLRELDEAIAALEYEAAPAPGPQVEREKKLKREPTSLPYRRFIAHGGQELWVGKSAAHSDKLTFRIAQGHHWWFHARGLTGAHVVAPIPRGQPLTPQLLADAAHLALHYSSARGEPRGEVQYAQVKTLRKGNAPGLVLLREEATILQRIEEERLAELLRSAQGATPE